MNRLRAMFIAAGIVVLGGGAYQLAFLRPEFEISDAIDAGVLKVSDAVRLSCRVHLRANCQDGGLRPYMRVGIRGRVVSPEDLPTLRDGGPMRYSDGGLVALGPPTLLMDPPRDAQGHICFEPVGTPEEACDLVEDAGCTVPAICGVNGQPVPEQEACACFRPDAGNCRVPTLPDAGGLVQATQGNTIQPPLIGPGCFRKFCGPEVSGDQGGSWPAECPQ